MPCKKARLRRQRVHVGTESTSEETRARMMGLGWLADEAAEEAAIIGEKKNRRDNLSMDEMMAMTREMLGEVPEEANTDHNAYCARVHREDWDQLFAQHYGPFDQTSKRPPRPSIPASRFTDLRRPNNRYAHKQEMLQIFWIKVGKIKKPLNYFCRIGQFDTLNAMQDRFLMLTGPTRGIVMNVHPIYVEVDLKAKGATESEDKDLSYLVVASLPWGRLILTYVRMYNCVEAAISVKVKKHVLWHGCRGLFTASTTSFENMEISLLAFEGDRLPVDGSGRLELSRRVVCVELRQPEGKLVFSAKALRGSDEKDVRRVRKTFTPKKVGKTKENIKIGTYEM
ncbi:hypothetical protein VPH35_098851 [Triticum aestivum]